MEGLSFDSWLIVARFLTVPDLCRCMRVSHQWFFAWASDRLWSHQKARVCAVCPEFVPIFDMYPCREEQDARIATASVKSNSNKKRKTAWIMPRRGTWYVFAKILIHGASVEKIKAKWGRDPDFHLLIGAAARIWTESTPCILSTTVDDTRYASVMFRVYLKTSKYRLKAVIRRGCNRFQWYINRLDNDEPVFVNLLSSEAYEDYMKAWITFLLEKRVVRRRFVEISHSFKHLIQEK